MENNKIIFYSNKCKYCKDLINLMNDNNIKDYKLINIDNIDKNKINFLQRVPTLLIPEKIPLIGINAFNYIKSNLYFNNNTNNINYNPNKLLNDDLLINHHDNNKNLKYKYNYSYLDKNKIEFDKYDILNNNDKMNIYPEINKLNDKNQKNKLNKLIQLRNSMNLDNNITLEKSSNIYDNNINKKLNEKINEINYSVELNKNNIIESRNIGMNTSRIKINKN